MRIKSDVKYSYAKYNYPDFSKQPITKEIAYYLGLVWSDGYVTEKSVILEINSSDFDDIKPILQKIGEFAYGKRTRKGRINSVSYCRLGTMKICKWFVDLDFKNKSKISPKKLINLIPDEFISYFFKGYLDGDGCVYVKNKTIQITFSGSYEQDWQFVENLFEKLDIKKYSKNFFNRLNKGKENKSSSIRLSNPKEIEKLKNYLPNIGLKRKYEKLNNYFK